MRALKVTHGNINNSYMFEKTDKSINDYPEKEIILADLFHLGDGKIEYVIMESESEEELYDGRQEYLEWTSEGCASSLCGRVIDYIDIGSNKILVYLKPERNTDNEQFKDVKND